MSSYFICCLISSCFILSHLILTSPSGHNMCIDYLHECVVVGPTHSPGGFPFHLHFIRRTLYCVHGGLCPGRLHEVWTAKLGFKTNSETWELKHLRLPHLDVGQNPVPPVNLRVDGHPLYHVISRFWPIPIFGAILLQDELGNILTKRSIIDKISPFWADGSHAHHGYRWNFASGDHKWLSQHHQLGIHFHLLSSQCWFGTYLLLIRKWSLVCMCLSATGE